MRIHYKKRRKPQFDISAQYNANESIRAPEVRVIDDEGNDLGVKKLAEALALAESKEVDLVEVAPKAQPPVCRLMDFGQFKYQKEKEMKSQKTKAKKVEVKGVRLSVKMGEHDIAVKRQKAIEFLEGGQKLKIEIILRGREKAHGDLAEERINSFIEQLKEKFELFIEQPTKRQGGNVSAIIGRK